MEVHCDEGVAIHIAPEPCVHARESMGEASVGERIGQPLSRERIQPGCRRRSLNGRQDGRRTSSRVPGRSGVVGDPGMCGRSLYGNREISRSADGHLVPQGPHREGEEP